MIVKSISLSSHVDAKRKVSISTFQEIEQKHSNLILKNTTSNSPLNIQITLRFYSQIVQIYEMKFNREIKSDFKLAFFKERGNKYTARKIIFQYSKRFVKLQFVRHHTTHQLSFYCCVYVCRKSSRYSWRLLKFIFFHIINHGAVFVFVWFLLFLFPSFYFQYSSVN